jgi:alpha-galactosidase
MTQIDDWTIDLLGNREVLAINQDPLGKAAGRVWADNWTQVWARRCPTGRWPSASSTARPSRCPSR